LFVGQARLQVHAEGAKHLVGRLCEGVVHDEDVPALASSGALSYEERQGKARLRPWMQVPSGIIHCKSSQCKETSAVMKGPWAKRETDNGLLKSENKKCQKRVEWGFETAQPYFTE
jgi:hypothetical protein